MFKSTGRGLCVCLIALIIGILIGGSLEAPVPHSNQTYMEVMPYGDVNVMTNVGDTIEWRTYGSSNLPTIDFGPVTPCGPVTNPCTIKAKVKKGLYFYSCGGNASCPDPGVGPITTTGPNPTLFGIFLKKFDAIVADIAGFLDFYKASGFRTENVLAPSSDGSEALSSPVSAPVSAAVAPRPANRTSAEIVCSGSTTVAPPISVSSNGSILWGSPDDFTITIIGATICNENLSTPQIWQICTLKNVKPKDVYNYTALDTSCSANPSASAQITIQ